MNSIVDNPDSASAAKSRATQLLPRTPALQALAVQFFATLLVATIMTIWALYSLPSMPPIAWAVLQAAVATLIAWGIFMESWWLVIHLIFLPVLVLALSMHIPSWIFLASFGLLFSLHGATYRTQVPLHLTRREVVDLLIEQLPTSKKFRCIDLGCGTGGVLSALVKQCENGIYTGVEAAIVPCFVSWIRGRIHGYKVVHGEISDTDIGDYDFVYAYLSPAAMPGLWQKACSEMRSGSVLISNSFAIPGVVPTRALCAANGMKLYLWRIEK